jgi:hypothetical protein
VRRSVIVALAVVVTAVTAFAGVTLVALEGKGVAVLHTAGPDGQPRQTRVWFAEDDGSWWVEAATASRPFYVDIATRPEVTVEIRNPPLHGQDPPLQRGLAQPVPEPGGHHRIRELLARKYGWADAWVAMLQDTSESRAVRIVPR